MITKPSIINLPSGFMATSLGQHGIALFSHCGWTPDEKAWAMLDKTDPNLWPEQVDMKFCMLFPREQDEILTALQSHLPIEEYPYCHSFKSGNTTYHMLPSPTKDSEVYIFDQRRWVWLPFNWDTQWKNLKELGFACKPITIQRQAVKAYGIQTFIRVDH